MAAMVGDLDVEAGGKTYCLHLGMRALAILQKEFGKGFLDTMTDGEPDFAVIVRMIEVSLMRHQAQNGDDLVAAADTILAERADVLGELLDAAFPDARGKPAGKKKAAA